MPPVIGETVKPGGSNRRKIGRDLYRWIAIARGTLSISPQKPVFVCLLLPAAGRVLKVWFTNRESEMPDLLRRAFNPDRTIEDLRIEDLRIEGLGDVAMTGGKYGCFRQPGPEQPVKLDLRGFIERSGCFIQ
jgi:hypothetical protein